MNLNVLLFQLETVNTSENKLGVYCKVLRVQRKPRDPVPLASQESWKCKLKAFE